MTDRKVPSGKSTALDAVASVFAQLWARIGAAERLRCARRAMVDAKTSGARPVEPSADQMAPHARLRSDIEVDLGAAIDRGALSLNYLPEVDMRTGEVLAVEALVRWQHPTWGLLLPDAFVGVAESINLTGELGRWVLRTACAEFAAWRSRGAGGNTTLRVNVSPDQVVADGFVDTVTGLIDEFAIASDRLCLEITESVAVQDIGLTRTALDSLKAVGVQIAIDDFGTGYSALSRVKTLPVDLIKVDRSFVRELGENAADLAIVKVIIALARSFNLQVVAEGVETRHAARTLLELGCHRAQGFLFSRPLSAVATEALLAVGSVSLAFR